MSTAFLYLNATKILINVRMMLRPEIMFLFARHSVAFS
jgi:hypothetical protein